MLTLTCGINKMTSFQPPSSYQAVDAKPAGYMALRSKTKDGSGAYDNLNKMSPGHGYDVPRASKTYTDKQMPAGEACMTDKIMNTVDGTSTLHSLWCLSALYNAVSYNNSIYYMLSNYPF